MIRRVFILASSDRVVPGQTYEASVTRFHEVVAETPIPPPHVAGVGMKGPGRGKLGNHRRHRRAEGRYPFTRDDRTLKTGASARHPPARWYPYGDESDSYHVSMNQSNSGPK